MLWAFQRAFTGEPDGRERQDARTSSLRELVVVVPLLGAQPVPRPLPEAGARPGRAHGRAASIAQLRAQDRLPASPSHRRSPSRSRTDRSRRRATARATRRSASDRRRRTRSRRRASTGCAIAPGHRARRRGASLIVLVRRCCAADPRSTPRRVAIAVGRRRRRRRRCSSGSGTTSSDDGPYHDASRAWCASTVRACSSASSCSSRRCSRCCSSIELPRRREQLEAPEYLALLLFSAAGMLVMTTANDLIVVFLALEILSIPLYVLAAFDRRRARVAGSRASSTSCSARSRRRSSSTASRSSTAPPAPRRSPDRRRSSRTNTLFEQGTLLAGHRAPARRPRLQGRGGAVPHVDARRVPGRAHAGHRVHGVGHQGRRRSPRCCGSLDRVRRCTATDWRPAIVGARGAHARWSAASSRCVQTDVKRMLAYSSIATPATSSSALEAGTPPGPAGRALLPARLHVHDDRLVRGRDGGRPRGDDHHSIDDYRGLGDPPAGARRAARLLPARPGRHPAHRRLHRQAGGLRRRWRTARRRRPAVALVLAADRRRRSPR